MLALALGAMVKIDIAFMFFGCYGQSTVATANQPAVDIRLASIFMWLFLKAIFDLLYGFKESSVDNGRIAMWIFLALDDYDTVIKRVIKYLAKRAFRPVNTVISLEFFV